MYSQTTIKTMDMFRPSVSILSSSSYLGNPAAIAFDVTSYNIFTANTVAGTIEVLKLKGDIVFRKILMANTGRNSNCIKPTNR